MRRFWAILFVASFLTACGWVSSVIHDDDLVASIGRDKLYLSEVRACVPAFASPEDSALLVQQYIDTWATSVLFQQMAEDSLSKEELDVDKELEEYRRSLIRYRYEQSYVKAHLDTSISQEQIVNYYHGHEENFVLERPILKLRFAVISKDSPSRELLMAALKSDDYASILQTDSVLRSVALKFADYSQTWTDAAVVAREYGLDYLSLLDYKSGEYIIYEPSGLGVQMIGYVVDMIRYGVAPVEFCSVRISEAILSARKRELLQHLERDLLTKARENNLLEITQ